MSDCGCVARRDLDKKSLADCEIEYCPLHSEAKTMSQWLANLARAAQRVHDVKGELDEDNWQYFQYIITASKTTLKRANKKEKK